MIDGMVKGNGNDGKEKERMGGAEHWDGWKIKRGSIERVQSIDNGSIAHSLVGWKLMLYPSQRPTFSMLLPMLYTSPKVVLPTAL